MQPKDPDEHKLWKQHTVHMRQALELARQASADGETPVGAVIVLDGGIIGKGYNQVERLGDPTAHAEMIALSAACDTVNEKYLPRATLYVTLEPCVMCTGALVWTKLGRVVFGASDPKGGACGSRFNLAQDPDLNHRAEIIQGILEQECSELLTRFFRSRR